MKKVSVIIFCHNAASYMDRCMASVMAQTMKTEELEIICVDDASSDGTWEHLQKWEQLFTEHVLLIRQEPEAGQEAAWNIGLQYASADWVTFADAKDWLEPDYFQQLYDVSLRYACDVVSCGWVKDSTATLFCLDEKDRVGGEGRYFFADTPEKKKELSGRILGDAVWGKIIRRNLLIKHQMDIDSVYILGEKLYHHFPETTSKVVSKGQGLRIVMFYSGTESFNFFTDRLDEELRKRGHEVFICDLDDVTSKTEHSYDNLNRFLSQKVDVVICFDGIGTREEQFIRQWNKHQAAVLDILMDPPFRFHPTLEKHPKDYMLFCCDQEHVDYVKKYFSEKVPNVVFMPHVGALIERDEPVISYKERKYDILFSASYYPPQSQMEKIKELFPEQPDMWRFYQQMFENLVKDSTLTIEKALLSTLRQFGLSVSDGLLKMLLNRSLYVDWAIRMYHRGRVVTALAEAGLELYLLGPGWEKHPSAGSPNVHRLDAQVPYRQTLMYMADARINLNVMPWFKAGTHDRVFNTLLQHSVPLTDPSSWLMEHFTDGEDIIFYDLDHLELLPERTGRLLADPVQAEKIIQKGYEKVSLNLTWSNCADWLLEAKEQIRRERG